MTIPYSYRVATTRGIGNFYKTLSAWHGSVYKMLWRDFVLYVLAYTVISLFYRLYMRVYDPEMAKTFGQLVLHFRANNSRIPIVFVLSFFVGIINERWWAQLLLIPWPDPICLQLSVLIQGQDRRGRLLRRTIARYLNLSIIFAFQLLSHDVRVRFPTLESYCDAGLLLPHELAILKSLKDKTNYPTYYIPVIWACNLVYRARREGRISHDVCRRNLILRIEKLRDHLLELLNFDVVFVPLAYTQVATIAVYVYFLVALIGNQFIDDPKEMDIYVPIFGFLEFIFFVGWFKVAEAMLNPYGNDDDDFELNWIIDRNIQVSFLMVDEVHRAVPTGLRSFYYETVLRKPYYVARRRRDGTYSHEVRPHKKHEPKPEEEVPRPSEVDGLFESFTAAEEKTFETVFEDLLTKAPPAPVPDEANDVIVEVPGSGSSEELEGDSVRQTRHPGRQESIGESLAQVASSPRMRRMSRASVVTDADVESVLRQRRQSILGRRLSLEMAAPGTYIREPQLIQTLSQPDELVPLPRTSDIRRSSVIPSERNLPTVQEQEEPKPTPKKEEKAGQNEKDDEDDDEDEAEDKKESK